ncbi:TPA: DUF1653 domain-containing protein [Bacillus cereus]|nr:DUF1653 domain-containing protein [Bacillus cereus]
MDNKKVKIYRYYKGGIYLVTGKGKQTGTDEEMVIYEDAKGNTWIESQSTFMADIEVCGVKVPRFEHLGNFYKSN